MSYKVPYECTLPWQSKWLLWLVIVFTSKHFQIFYSILRAPALKAVPDSKLLPPRSHFCIISGSLLAVMLCNLPTQRDEIWPIPFLPLVFIRAKACVCRTYWCFWGDRVGLQGRSLKYCKTESKTHSWKPPAILPTEVPWLLSLVCLLLLHQQCLHSFSPLATPQPTTGLSLYTLKLLLHFGSRQGATSRHLPFFILLSCRGKGVIQKSYFSCTANCITITPSPP